MKSYRLTPIYSALILALYPTTSLASIVNENIDYQYFRDFAENKGAFTVGAENIKIYDKQGNLATTLTYPMPDFSSQNSQSGVATLINEDTPQYLSSVKHNVGYWSTAFGGHGNNPDYNRATYNLVNRNEQGNRGYEGKSNRDYHAPRVDKLVTEVAPAEVTEETTGQTYLENSFYGKRKRFPIYYRMGSGRQYTFDPNTAANTDDIKKIIPDGEADNYPYFYLIGGTTIGDSDWVRFSPWQGKLQFSMNNEKWKQAPFNSTIQSGDSGSALYAYDTKLSKWVLIAAAQSGTTWLNRYEMIDGDFLKNTYDDDKGPTIINQTQKLNWQGNTNDGKNIVNEEGNTWTFSGRDNSKTITPEETDSTLHTQEKKTYLNNNNYAKDAGKNIIFKGTDATISLNNNIDQGAGSITFDGNYTVKSDTNRTYTGAGIIVNADKTVKWQVNGLADDALHRVGKGNLIVAGSGANPAGLRLGDGTTYLQQTADDNGAVQAASYLHLASGRPTAVLADENQIKGLDNVYFGFRGGHLDLNGTNLSGKRIHSVDSGAHIINNNANQSSTINLAGYAIADIPVTVAT